MKIPFGISRESWANVKIPYAVKRLFRDRFGLSAVLFLLALFLGTAATFTGVLANRTACAGYVRPALQEGTSSDIKGDPTTPQRNLSCPSTTLRGDAPATSLSDRLKETTAKAEAAVAAAMDGEHGFIQLFGAFQNFTDRTAVEDTASPSYGVSKLKNGSLTFVGQGEPDGSAEAAELKRLQLALDAYDIPLLYIQAPSKLEPGNDGLPYGVTDTGNACADRLLDALEAVGVDAIDLRETLAAQGKPWEDWFYATDHHWNQDAAFLAFQTIGEKLTDYTAQTPSGQGTRRAAFQWEDKYLDAESYQKETLPRWFLGSQGKRVGSLYGGVDDFTLWTPKFPTLLRYEAPAYGVDRYGDATETVLFPERVEERDWFSENPYVYYSGGDYAYAHIQNYYNPDGPKVLLIRESFACAVTPYLAYACSEVTTIDPRYFTGDLMSYVAANKPDVVMILYSAGTTRDITYFRLLPQPAAPGKADSLKWGSGQ